MPETYDMQIDSLRLRAPSSWEFFPFDAIILGRRDSKIGSLQISLAFAADVPSQADHETCLDVLHRFMNEPQSKVVYAEERPQDNALFGQVTIHNEITFERYWYRHRNRKLILATYKCHAGDFARASEEIEEAGAIAATLELRTNK